MGAWIQRHRTLCICALVVLLTAAVRMPFWLSYTHAYGHGDAIIWQVWARSIHEHGFINVLRTADSNNVGYHYVLWPTSAIYAQISPEFELWTPAFRVLIKIPPFLCDLALAALIFAVARSFIGDMPQPRRDVFAAGAALAFSLAPASVYDSMWWSQTDSVITLCMLGSVVLLARGSVAPAWAAWALGFLAKPQPLVIVPVLAAFTLWRFGPAGVARGALATAVVFGAAVAPFVAHGDARLVADTYERMFEQDPIDLAQGAWNGWSILDVRGNPLPGDAAMSIGGLDVSYSRASLALCALVTLVALAYLRRRQDLSGLLFAGGMMVFAFYSVPTSTHERYLYPMFAMLAPLLVRERWLAVPYGMLAVTFMLNLLAINPPSDASFWEWHGTRFAVAVAALHVAAFVAAVAWMAWSAFAPRGMRQQAPAVALAPTVDPA